MKYRLVIRVEAVADLEQAAAWYDDELPGLGHRFLQSVWHTLETVVERPLSYPIIESTVRWALLNRFPYLVYFMIEETTIHVLAILHGHRDSKAMRPRFQSE